MILKRVKKYVLNTTSHFKEPGNSCFEVLYIVCPAALGPCAIAICATDTQLFREMYPVMLPDNIPVCSSLLSAVPSVLDPSAGLKTCSGQSNSTHRRTQLPLWGPESPLGAVVGRILGP